MATRSSGPDLQTLEKLITPSFFTEKLWRKYELELTGFISGLLIILMAGILLKFTFVPTGVIFTIIGLIVSVLSFVGIIFKWAEED